jgi:Ca-activated chloride channel family protein
MSLIPSGFERPGVLLLLLPAALILLGSILGHARRRQRFSAAFGGRAATQRLVGAELTRFPRALLLPALAALLAIVAAANPEREGVERDTRGEPGDVLIGIDISLSMQATDIAPNRLEAARRAALALADGLDRQQRVGVFLFAGQPYLLVPPTDDRDLAGWFLDAIQPELYNGNDEGTGIGAALDRAVTLFEADDRPTSGRSVVIISDGETAEDGDELSRAARSLASRGITLFMIGVGTGDGAPVAIPGRPGQWGGPDAGPGNPRAVARLNEELLREVARAGGGSYSSASAATTPDLFGQSAITRAIRSSTEASSLDAATLLAGLAFLLLAAEPARRALRRRHA